MNPLAARFSDVPALIDPRFAARFEASLVAIAAHPRAADILGAHAVADDGFWPAADDWRAAYRPYVVRDGILQIPVKGVLLHDFPWAIGSWATGYLYIARALARGLDDPMVQGIGLICDSGGGEVAGCFELVDKVYAARSVKPIRAFAHECAYSAAYAVACGASRIVVSRTGGVGSIGVRMTHVDVSRAMEDMGIKITFIFAGKHKVDGNAYEPLPDAVKARWQSIIDEDYALFCATVARNRGMDESAVAATEAECFTAAEAVENGLADVIGPLDDEVAAFATDPQAADEDEGEEDMSTAAAAPAAITAASLDAATTTARTEGHAAGRTEGLAEGEKTGRTAERSRISAILGSDEAKSRTELAQHLAFESDMSADDAKKLLAKSPKQVAVATDPLAAAMANVKNPNVGADVSGDKTEADEAVALAGSIVQSFTGKAPAAAH